MYHLRLTTMLLAAALMSTATCAEELRVTFGAVSDLAARYAKHDLTGNAKQSGDIASPQIIIGGLDLDGIGDHDDSVEVTIAVSVTGGELARLAQGYRLDAGC